MGILDELKQQADTRRTAEADEATRLAGQEAYYQAVLRPVMLKVLTYLDELVKHINYVQPERVLHYPLAPNRQTAITLQQGNYKLLIDSSDTPRQIDIRVAAKLAQPEVYVLADLPLIRQYAEYLDDYALPYHRQDALNSTHKVDKATFTLEGPLQHAVRIKADTEQQCLVILLRNFGRAGIQSHRFSPDKIDDALLDRLGRVLLHDVDSLPVPTPISDTSREQLRQQLQAAAQQETASQQELEAEKVRERLKKSWAKKMLSAKLFYSQEETR